MADPKDLEVSQPPTDGISALSFSPTAEFLCAASWDGQVRIWEVQPSGGTVPKAAVQHDQSSPVLCATWSTDGARLFSAGASKTGKLFDLQSGQSMPLAQHDAPIKCAAFFDAPNMPSMLVTGSWDKTLRVRLFLLFVFIVSIGTLDRQLLLLS